MYLPMHQRGVFFFWIEICNMAFFKSVLSFLLHGCIWFIGLLHCLPFGFKPTKHETPLPGAVIMGSSTSRKRRPAPPPQYSELPMKLISDCDNCVEYSVSHDIGNSSDTTLTTTRISQEQCNYLDLSSKQCDFRNLYDRRQMEAMSLLWQELTEVRARNDELAKDNAAAINKVAQVVEQQRTSNSNTLSEHARHCDAIKSIEDQLYRARKRYDNLAEEHHLLTLKESTLRVGYDSAMLTVSVLAKNTIQNAFLPRGCRLYYPLSLGSY
jgi:hypothetical protein